MHRIICINIIFGNYYFSFQMCTHHKRRNHDTYQTWYKHLFENTQRSNITLNPKHNCSHITYRRKGTATIRSQNDKSRIEHTFLMINHQLTQYHNHHDTRCQIVQYCTQKKCHEYDSPHQSTFAFTLHLISYKIESTIGINDLHNSHCSQKENNYFASITKVFQNFT